MRTYTSEVIANFFRAMTDPDIGDVLSNLKLQKLCYYAAGLMAATRQDETAPLFNDNIEAWQHGPVVPTEYHRYKQYGASAIPPIQEFDFSQIASCDKDVLEDVFSFYGQYSAWKLRDMTHEESPWLDAYRLDDKTISAKSLEDHFSSEVSERYIKSYHEASQKESEVV